MSIFQFLAPRVSGVRAGRAVSEAQVGRGDRISGVLDQRPDLPLGVAAAGVAVGDARSGGTSTQSITRQQRVPIRCESSLRSGPVDSRLRPCARPKLGERLAADRPLADAALWLSRVDGRRCRSATHISGIRNHVTKRAARSFRL